jgi:AraC-like DNA-binding protein
MSQEVCVTEKNKNWEKYNDCQFIVPDLISLTNNEELIKNNCILLYVAQNCPVFIKLANSQIRLEVNDAFLLHPCMQHEISSLNCHSCYRISICNDILFSSFLPMISGCRLLLDFFVQSLSSDEGMEYIKFQYNSCDELSELIQNMCVEYQNKKKSFETVIMGNLAAVMAILSRSYTAITSPSYILQNNKLTFILNYFRENLATVSLESTAVHFKYHPNSISSILHKELGMGFSELIRNMRLEKACKLLTSTDLPVNEIAHLCGYGNMGNFYKIFKTTFGVTPKSYTGKKTQQLVD